MKGGGGNVIENHAEEISLSALFLLEAAKKADREFCTHRSTSHTIRDANKDILTLANHSRENTVTSTVSERNSPNFHDPYDDGLKKVCTKPWVHQTLANVPVEEDLEGDNTRSGEVDMDYELFDTS